MTKYSRNHPVVGEHNRAIRRAEDDRATAEARANAARHFLRLAEADVEAAHAECLRLSVKDLV